LLSASMCSSVFPTCAPSAPSKPHRVIERQADNH
jgi:hypothetical protein